MYKLQTKYILLFIISLVNICAALYEDQVGKFDWKLSYIGKPKFAHLNAKIAYVVGEENVIAALHVNTGHIIWRQILENSKENQIRMINVDKELVTVSGDGSSWYVRGWELQTGTVLFEWTLHTENNENVKWVVNNGQLIQITPSVGSQLQVTGYQLNTGRISGVEKTISTPWVTDLSNCVLSQTYFACVSSNDVNGQLYYVDVISEDNRISAIPVQKLVGEIPGRLQIDIYPQPKPSVMLVRGNTATIVNLEDGTVLPYSVTPNSRIVDGDRTLLLQLEINPDNPQKLLRIVSSDVESDYKNTVDVGYPLGLGAPYSIASNSRGNICDLLLTSSDHALTLVRLPEGKIMWTREEALSHIVAVEFLELPVSELDASIESEFQATGDVFTMLYKRLVSQARQLSKLFLDNPLLSSSNGLVRDEFGLHKLIVVATSAGKLFAIDTLSGTIVWSYRLPNVVPFKVLGEDSILLFVQRTARYAPFPAHCVLLAQDAHTGNGILFRFDPISGHSKSGIERLTYKIKQATVLAQEDENHMKPLVILSSDGRFHIYPDSVRDVVSSHAKTTYFYDADPELGVLHGYSLDYENLKVKPVWNLTLGPSQLVALSVRPALERVHSQGRVLPDRSVYYKYVNPNMIAVSTITEDTIHKHVLSVYLIDGVTGLVIYSASHRRAKGPVHLVHSENWIVYSYFSERYRRSEIAAVELYEGFIQSNSSVFSSYAVSQLPHAETQAYILPATPLAMTTTLTERGITTKFLLIALTNGVVTEIPWLMLQPRLPDVACGPEESCIPYMPEIPLPPEAAVNYNQTLERVRGISVAPARLESNCHVLVHGLDLFYTRVAPSKTFDVLKEDFDHRLIVLVLAGLVIASYVAKKLASRKALKQAWK